MISNNVRFKSQGDYGIKPLKCHVVRGPVGSDSDMCDDLLWLCEAQHPMAGFSINNVSHEKALLHLRSYFSMFVDTWSFN